MDGNARYEAERALVAVIDADPMAIAEHLGALEDRDLFELAIAAHQLSRLATDSRQQRRLNRESA